MRFLLTFLFTATLLTGSYSFAAEYTFEIAWAIEESVGVELAGFRLYDIQQNKICETTNSAATSMVCTVDIAGAEATYTLVSYSTAGAESNPSDPFTIVFEEISSLKAIVNLMTTPGSLAVNFNGTASTGSITQFLWDFGDGTIDDSNTAITQHTFPAPGTYDISLTITDESGATTSMSQQIILSQNPNGNQPPIASLVVISAVIGPIPLTVQFDASDSLDPEGTALAYFWNFGDGTTATTGTELTSHQYTEPGTYTASITVTDNQGAMHSTTSQPILVIGSDTGQSEFKPTARIVASKKSGLAPVAVTFNGTESTPSQQDGSITQYRWNFGDGSTGSNREEQHMFTAPGNYTIQLTVTDNLGRQAVTTKIFAVQDPSKQNTVKPLVNIYKILLLKD